MEAIPKRNSAIAIADMNSVSMFCASNHTGTAVSGAGIHGSEFTLVSSKIMRKPSVHPTSCRAVVAALPRHRLIVRRHGQRPRAITRVSRVEMDGQSLQEWHQFRLRYYGRGELLLRVTPSEFHQR